MNNREIIQEGINYIEQNLKTDISVPALARSAGFSLYHYYRVFQQCVGISVQQYIVRRRLLNAIFEIGTGRKMVDTAFDYGFDTYAGFYKAFHREFGCSPSAYLKYHRAKKPYKIDLFQEEQIMITHKRVAQMLAAWNLPEAEITDAFYDGTDRQNEHTYYIGETYVLKISANLGALKRHLDISKALDASGIRASTPVLTCQNAEYIQHGELYACLTHRLKGYPIRSEALYREQQPQTSEFIGRSLARLHLALKTLDDIVVRDNDLLSLVEEIALPKSRSILNLDSCFCVKYLTQLETLFPLLPRQLIHRDPHPGNIMVEDGTAGFLDFDLSERNFRLYDICYTATAILSDTFQNSSLEHDAWLDIYRAIFTGYHEITPLTPAEWEAAPYVVLANQFVCVSWFSQQAQYADVFHTNTAMTKWLIENFDALRLP